MELLLYGAVSRWKGCMFNSCPNAELACPPQNSYFVFKILPKKTGLKTAFLALLSEVLKAFKKEIYFERYLGSMKDTRVNSGKWVDNRLWFDEVLPPGFQNWLEFYDEIPAEHRDKETVQYMRVYDASGIMGVFSIVPPHHEPQIQVVHSVRMEFLLARVAELLLPARLSKETLGTLLTKFRVSQLPDYSLNHAEFLLTPLWEVAKP